MTYLYLLPFKDGKHFKLGISKSLHDRVKTHYSNYDLDLDKALVVASLKTVFVLSLEQELLLLLDNPKYPKCVDGHTEIRLMKDFEKAVQYIKDKNECLGFQIEKYYGSKFKKKPDSRLIKHISALTRIIKRLKLTKTDMANRLNITEDEYNVIEESGCKNSLKISIALLLASECDNIKDRCVQTHIKYELLKILEEINKDL